MMLSKARTLTGYRHRGLDDQFGKVKDFYFDDREWTIRYLVADTDKWLVRSPSPSAATQSSGRLNRGISPTSCEITRPRRTTTTTRPVIGRMGCRPGSSDHEPPPAREFSDGRLVQP